MPSSRLAEPPSCPREGAAGTLAPPLGSSYMTNLANLGRSPAWRHPMLVPVHEAKTQLSRLIEAALAGEEVVIARGRTPVVRLVPLARSGVVFGLLKDRVPPGSAPDFLEPMDDDELALWEGRGDDVERTDEDRSA